MYTRTPQGCKAITKLGPMHISHYGIRNAFQNDFYVFALADTKCDCLRLAYALGLEKTHEEKKGDLKYRAHFGHGVATMEQGYGGWMLRISNMTWEKEKA